MRRPAGSIILALLALGVLSTSSACSQPPPTSTPSATPAPRAARDSGANGVAIVAAPADASYLASKGHAPDHWGFTVQFDTHSGDLLQIDPATAAVLRGGDGQEARPIAWQGLTEDSHHRSGLLTFSGRRPEGTMELLFADIAGVSERVLKWD